MSPVPAPEPVPFPGGGGASGPAGAVAPYQVYAVGTVFPVGGVTDYFSAGSWKLYQRITAGSGVLPTVAATWTEITAPIVISSIVNPNTAHDTDVNGVGILGAHAGTVCLTAGGAESGSLGSEDTFVYDPTYWGSWMGISGGTVIDTAADIPYVMGIYSAQFDGAGDGSVYSYPGQAYRNGSGDGDANGLSSAQRNGSGTGNANGLTHASVQDTATGNADARRKAEINDTAVGSAVSGDASTHHTSGEAHIYPRANATEAYVDLQGAIDMPVLGSTPAAPAASHLRLYAKIGAGGKVALYVLFPSGAEQQIKIEA